MLKQLEVSKKTFETIESVEGLLPQLEESKQKIEECKKLLVAENHRDEKEEYGIVSLNLFLQDVQNSVDAVNAAITESLKSKQHKPYLIEHLVDFANSKIEFVSDMLVDSLPTK